MLNVVSVPVLFLLGAIRLLAVGRSPRFRLLSNGCYLFLATVALLASPAAKLAGAADKDTTVARVGNEVISQTELDRRLTVARVELERQWYQHQLRVIDEMAQEALLRNEAKKRNITVAELRRQEIDAKARVISDAEVDEYIQVNKARIPPGLTDPRPQARQMLEKQTRDARLRVFMGNLRDKYKVEILMPEPFVPPVQVNTKGAPALGPEKAPVTILEFSDFQCPYCKTAVPTLKRLSEKYGDRVRLVYRHFPLPDIHPRAMEAALAASCAAEQGKFWPYHDVLFNNQQKLEKADLIRYGGEVGLSVGQFEKCMASPKAAAVVADDIAEARALGLSTTPTFFINGRVLLGAQPFENFEKLIERELNRSPVGAKR